ncbi:MAG: glutamate formimidoyltransferase [Armatimonadetes bacterium]|nr:glutamate formimidoyltransferase [Armatimonadota bacterium]
MKPLVQVVPNFSEGRRGEVVAAIADAAARVGGARLLDVSSDPDHNRTVVTIIGFPDAVVAASLAAASVAVARIDMRAHRGAHPRVGAVDVVPFIPLRDVSRAACAALARFFARRLWERDRVPIYYYAGAETGRHARTLADLRRGGFESLAARMREPRGRPDVGAPHPHQTAGAAIVGARPLLVAFNVNLASDDVAAAKIIARHVRASSGGLPGIQAIGVRLASRGIAQVSMNLYDLAVATPRVAWEAVRREAAALGVEVAGCEIVGLAPAFALADVEPEVMRLDGDAAAKTLERVAAPALDEGRFS